MAEDSEKQDKDLGKDSAPGAVVTRFAPSPTGYLHLGNLRAAVLSWLFARAAGGRFILRIDDTDPGRSREAYVAAIREDLEWLGLRWDEELRQSTRLARYREAAERLKALQRLYPCYETPDELALKRKLARMQGKPPVYDRAALRLSSSERRALEAEGRRPHWRFLLARDGPVVWQDLIRGRQAIDPASLSDPVLVREDGSFLYLLPSVVDDMETGVTHVIRGEDHVTNTAEQIQIIEALGGRVPAFAHFPLLLGPDGRPLAKRAAALSVRELRRQGVRPLTILALLATLGTGRAPESVTSVEELIAGFDISAFSRAAVALDPERIRRVNRHVLHHSGYEEVKDLPELQGIDKALWDVVRPNLDSPADLAHWRRVVAGPLAPVIAPDEKDFLREAAACLPETWGGDSWARWIAALKARTDRRGRALFRPLRLAITARERGPEMARLLPLIPRERVRQRLLGEEA